MDTGNLFEVVSDPAESSLRNTLNAWIVAETPLMNYFEEVEEEAALPDLFGKSVLVGPDQFSNVHGMIKQISKVLEMPQPLCFIYDSSRYEIDSEGVKLPRLEVSVKILQDFSEKELIHVLSKELFHIKVGHTRVKILVSKMTKLLNILPELPVVNILKQFGSNVAFEATAFHFRSVAFSWYKAACFSAERFALSATDDICSSTTAILLTIFNSKKLVDSINLSSYISQIPKIESCLGPAATVEVTNEALPYGPYRILNMITFALSGNYIIARNLVKSKWET
ncbi:MAG: hypothetical protein WA705_16915 [Candidatus Ozemobacteraceae bacterium]